MRKSVKLAIRASEIKTEINALDPGDSTVEKRRELLGQLNTVEGEYRSALTEEAEVETRSIDAGGLTPEERERRGLEARAELRNAITAVIEDRALTGAEHELQSAAGLTGNSIPWEMIAPRRIEERVDAVTAAPTNSHLIQHSILGRVFARSATMTLGVNMPMVPVGDQNFPVITAGSSGSILAKDASVGDATAATITANTLSPKRLQAEYLFRREDAARLMGLEEALRGDLSDTLSDLLDRQVLAGAGTGANIGGFLATAANGGLAAVTAPSAIADYAEAASTLAGGVEGKYSGSESECSVVLGDDTYRLLASKFETGSGESATAMYKRLSMKTMASANIPDAAATVQDGVLARMGAAGVNAICPVWNQVALIRDEVSQTLRKQGRISVTALMLVDFKILRAEGFQRLRYKIAA